MPTWFWPTAGAILPVVAIANFSSSNAVVLAAQAYIAAFHAGAVFYHLILEHHPLTGCAPAVFIVMAFIVMWLRTSILMAMVGTCSCIVFASGFSKVLVYPPAKLDVNANVSTSQSNLLS